jgi:glycosyltransferase involved in cell wall biosynthesis
VGKKLNKPVIWAIHEGLDPKTYRVFPQSLFFESFKYPVKYMFPARATYDFYKDFIPESKSNVVHCGVDVEEVESYKAKHDIKQVKKKLAIPMDHKVVSIVGFVSEIKGQIHFAGAAINLLKSSVDKKLTFLIIGSKGDAYSAKVQHLIDKAGFSQNIKLIPVVTDVYKYFNISDICVNSSFTESFCIANLEAMAFKKPLMITNVCGNPEQIIHNETGILYSLDNIEAEIEKNLKYLLDNPAIANNFAQNAYNRLVRNFTFDITLANFNKLLEI